MEEHLKSRDSIKIKNGQDKSGTITTNGEGKQGNNSTFICQEVDEKYFLSEKMIAGFERHKERHAEKGTGFGYVPKNEDDKGNSLRANAALAPTDNMLIVHNTQPRSSNRPSLQKNKNAGGSGHLTRNDGKTYCLDGGNTNAIEIKYEKEIEKSLSNEKATTIDASYYKGFGVRNGACRQVVQVSTNNKSNGGTQPYQQDRVYDIEGISPSLNTDGRSHAVEVKGLNENQQNKFNPNINSDKANALTLAIGRANSSSEYMDSVSKIANITSRIRRLTPIECERLQTVKDNYTNCVSDSQRYKMLGNGWTIEVIAHLLSYLKSI
jgi:site-specific DNA-cytosine methylase